MTEPVIHFHPNRKGGLRPNDPSKPRLKLRALQAVRRVPEHPISSDLFGGVMLGLDRNDDFGTCVPTGVDNFIRMVSRSFTGSQVSQTLDTIDRWYRTQNPRFNPNVPGGVEDNGMVIQDFLSYLVREGVILAFAEIDPADDEMLKAANYLRMGPINGALLMEAQVREQYNVGLWDFDPFSPRAGGHCFTTGAYTGDDMDEEDCATWAKRVSMTARFLDAQRSEAWAVILPMHLEVAAFRSAIDIAALAAGFEGITGRPFPFPIPSPEPQPEPSPAPGGPDTGWFHLDAAVAQKVAAWATRHRWPLSDAANELLRRELHVRKEGK